MTEVIRSKSNPRIKLLVKLRESARRRREMSLFTIEGLREIEAGMAARLSIVSAFFCPPFFRERGEERLLEQIENTGAETFELSKEVFSKCAYRENPEGIILLANTRSLELDGSALEGKSLVLVLDQVEKPGNLGAILRTASAFAVDYLLLSDPSVDLHNPNVTRASRGLSLNFPLALGSKEEIVTVLRGQGFRILGTSTHAGTILWDANLTGRTAILMGSESKGLGSFWRGNCNETLIVPMSGEGDSLNVSAAAACILGEASRQRRLN